MDWKDKLATWGGVSAIIALFVTFAITSFNRLDTDIKLCLQKLDKGEERFHEMQAFIYQEMREFQKEMREIHGRVSSIEEHTRK